ncbi:hypothetical protein Tco_0692538 [Tanacetum coccineum]
MANLLEDIQCAGSDTQPPMLDRTDFASWQQRIRLYCQGKENGVKLNRGLRDSNYDQLYAYLKQHEAHANENKMMLDRFTQHTVDPLALMSNEPATSSLTGEVCGSKLFTVDINSEVRGTMLGLRVQLDMGDHRQNWDANPCQARQIKCYNYNGIGHIARNYTQPKRGQDNIIDEDVDEQPVQDLALNVDKVFQANDCDALIQM